MRKVMPEKPQEEYEGNRPGGESTGEFESEGEKKAFEEAEARRLAANRPGRHDNDEVLRSSRPR
jgi:hypothetical protein